MNASAAGRSVAAFGLPNSLPAPTEPLDPDAWRTLVAHSEGQRLNGLLTAAATAGDLVANDAQLEELAVRDERWQSHTLQMERLLLDTLGVLHDVDTRVFKGPALAHTVYPNPSHRVFGDVDILVPGTQLAAARSALVTELGGVDVLPELRPGFDAQFAKDVMIRVGDAEVDLHRTLAAGPFGLRLPVDTLFEGSDSFQLGDSSVATLSPLHTFLQVCYNAALGDIPPRLLSLRDVAQVWLTSSLDLNEVTAVAHTWGGASVVARAVDLTWSVLGLTPCELSTWAAHYSPGPMERRLLAASVSQSRSYTRQVASIAAVSGLGPRLRYTHAIISPSAQYLTARGWTRGRHLRRAWQRLRPGRHSLG